MVWKPQSKSYEFRWDGRCVELKFVHFSNFCYFGFIFWNFVCVYEFSRPVFIETSSPSARRGSRCFFRLLRNPWTRNAMGLLTLPAWRVFDAKWKVWKNIHFAASTRYQGTGSVSEDKQLTERKKHIEIPRDSHARLDALITCADIDARAAGATDGAWCSHWAIPWICRSDAEKYHMNQAVTAVTAVM